MRAYERLLQYVKFHTTSSEETHTHPSTERQFALAKYLEQEMRALGLQNVLLDDHCYVYGTLPATPGHEAAPGLGFIAHMDTSDEASGENVQPIVHSDYNGEDINIGFSSKFLTEIFYPAKMFFIPPRGRVFLPKHGS